MRIKIYLLIIALSTFAFYSCDETKEETKYPNWKKRNIAFIDSLQNVIDDKSDLELEFVTDSRVGKNIFYKVLEKGDNTQARPFLTSTVNVYYRGMLIDENVFSAAPTPKHYTELYKDLEVFDQNFAGEIPDLNFEGASSFYINESSLTNGFREILQWMYPGARWEVYIPYQSAYGTSGTTDGRIPGYSTLIFDIILKDVAEY